MQEPGALVMRIPLKHQSAIHNDRIPVVGLDQNLALAKKRVQVLRIIEQDTFVDAIRFLAVFTSHMERGDQQ